MIKITEHNADFWQNNIDTRKMTLQFLRHLWIVILGMLLGMLVSVGIYKSIQLITASTQYQGYSEFYLDFATDEKGDAYQWYNGYTWTGLMSAEPIVSSTLAEMNEAIDVSRIEADTVAEIKSDIRVLRVTFTDSDMNICADLQSATEKSLIKLGSTVKEFNSISLIKSVEPVKMQVDNRTVQALELGALAGVLITLIVLWFAYILDDKVTTISDLDNMGVPVLGVILNKENNLSALLAPRYTELDTEGECFGLRLDTVISGQNGDIWDKAASSPRVLIEIPYRRVSRSMCRLAIDSIISRGGNVCGLVITDADAGFYRAYFCGNSKGQS